MNDEARADGFEAWAREFAEQLKAHGFEQKSAGPVIVFDSVEDASEFSNAALEPHKGAQ